MSAYQLRPRGRFDRSLGSSGADSDDDGSSSVSSRSSAKSVGARRSMENDREAERDAGRGVARRNAPRPRPPSTAPPPRDNGVPLALPEPRNKGGWSQLEHVRFVDALRVHGRLCDAVAEAVGTRSLTQVRYYYYTHFQLQRQGAQEDTSLLYKYERLERIYGDPYDVIFQGMIQQKVRQVLSALDEFIELEMRRVTLKEALDEKNREYQEMREVAGRLAAREVAREAADREACEAAAREAREARQAREAADREAHEALLAASREAAARATREAAIAAAAFVAREAATAAIAAPRASGGDDAALAHAEAQRMFGAPPPFDATAAHREAQRLFGGCGRASPPPLAHSGPSVNVRVPPGVSAGQMMQFQMPLVDGAGQAHFQTVQVQVPVGHVAGSTFMMPLHPPPDGFSWVTMPERS